MTNEDNMRVYVVDSRYEGDLVDGLKITDVPSVPFLNCRNPLYVGVRQGQVTRMKNNIHQEKLDGTSIGYWDLKGSYVSKKGTINYDAFKNHDVIFFANPDRADETIRSSYASFIEVVKQTL
jgi:hypothetical protein